MKRHEKSLEKLIKKTIGFHPKTGAEIGVYLGKTSAFLRNKFPTLEMVFVDPWRAWDKTESYSIDRVLASKTVAEWNAVMAEASANIASVEGAPYRILRMESSSAARKVEDNSLDFVFIDANHTYESVKEDIELWLPKTRRLICGHDYDSVRDRQGIFGVSKAVNEIFGEENILVRKGLIWAYVIED